MKILKNCVLCWSLTVGLSFIDVGQFQRLPHRLIRNIEGLPYRHIGNIEGMREDDFEPYRRIGT